MAIVMTNSRKVVNDIAEDRNHLDVVASVAMPAAPPRPANLSRLQGVAGLSALPLMTDRHSVGGDGTLYHGHRREILLHSPFLRILSTSAPFNQILEPSMDCLLWARPQQKV